MRNKMFLTTVLSGIKRCSKNIIDVITMLCQKQKTISGFYDSFFIFLYPVTWSTKHVHINLS